MKKAFIALSIASVLTTSMCSAFEWPDFSTSYKHNTLFRGGYQESQVGKDLYQVTFEGNCFTSKRQAVQYALVRAAEVAQKNNDNYFIILDKAADTSGSQQIITQNIFSFDDLREYLGLTIIGASASTVSTNPTCTFMIKTFNEKPSCENYLSVSDILNANADILSQRNK